MLNQCCFDNGTLALSCCLLYAGGMATVRSILDDHEADIIAQIAALRSQLVPLERELMEVRLAKSAVDRGGLEQDQPRLVFSTAKDERSPEGHVDAWRRKVVFGAGSKFESPYARLTIKSLIIKALAEHFSRGATSIQLLDFFSNAWGRSDVVRTSLSPQLSRLRSDGVLFRRGPVWHLSASHNLNFKSNKTATDQ